MSEAHEHLRRMMAGTPDQEGQRYQWPHVLAMLQQVRTEPSADSEDVLRALAQYEGRLLLDEEAGLPHSMSPEDLLRSLAVQTLGQWNAARHADAIRRAAELADTDRVVRQARSFGAI